jgi:hypothetical protein
MVSRQRLNHDSPVKITDSTMKKLDIETLPLLPVNISLIHDGGDDCD